MDNVQQFVGNKSNIDIRFASDKSYPLQITQCAASENSIDVQNVTQLLNLPLELLLDIYEQFELPDLVNISKTHPRNQEAADIVFRNKYSNGLITITGQHIPNVKIIVHSQGITFYGMEITLQILQAFGHLMTKLQIQYRYINEEDRKKVNDYITKFCGQTLSYIDLVDCNGDELDSLTGPFTELSELRFQSGFLNTERVRLDQVFPAMRTLYQGSMSFSNLTCFEYNFAHLEQYDIVTHQDDYPPSMAKLIKKNPQLKRSSLFNGDMELLKLFNENVPKLERFEVEFFDDFHALSADESIRFENLRKLRFGHIFRRLPVDCIPLEFAALEEFEHKGQLKEWFDVIKRATTLKILTIGGISSGQLKEIGEHLPILETFTVSYVSEKRPENVISFMRNGEHLKKVSFGHIDAKTREAISEQLSSEWQEIEDYIFISQS